MLRALLAVAFVIGCAVSSAWAKPCPMPTEADFARTWVGEAGGEYFNLQMDPGGTGVLAIQSVGDHEPEAWFVRATKITNRRIDFSLEPASSSTERLFLHGTGCRDELFLEVGSVPTNWKLDVRLRPEPVLAERLRATTAATVALRQSQSADAVGVVAPSSSPCSFPGQRHHCSGPWAAATIEWREATASRGHELWLHRGARVDQLLEFGRSVDVLWSKDGTALAITNHLSSDGSDVRVVRLTETIHPVSIEEVFNRALGRPLEIYRHGHRYFTAVSWESASSLRFQIRAFDAYPNVEFVGEYRYELGGQVQRISTRAGLPYEGSPASEVPDFSPHGAVFDVGPGVTPPKPRHRVPIAVPQDLRGKQLEQRTTTIEVVVDDTGKVQQPRIVQSSYPSFDQAAVDAVRHWEYEPGTKDGRKVAVRITITASPEM